MGRSSRMLKAAALLALGYCVLLVYQGGVTFNFQESPTATLQGNDITVDTVTKIVEDVEPKNVTINDIFISVKTTKHYQFTRLPVILQTWFQLAKSQIWFFTDTDNKQHSNLTGGHMINTNCSASHQRTHLCCKMSVEYDHFLDSEMKWFCHFDDDNYVNVPQLVKMLQKYNHQDDWYLGRTSVYEPVNINKSKTTSSFWFATGGAGFCISRSLALKMLPVASGGKFISICERIRLPDDVTMGFVIEHLMQKNLTIVPEFHSHLEQMKLLDTETFREQISFSYSMSQKESNVVDVPGFDTRYDPTRFLSLHCFLFPHFKFCPR